MAAVSSLPPGPRLPRLMQTLGFIVSPRRYLRWVHRRYGEVVTLSTLFDSRFVMVFEPEIVKQVFKGSPDQLRAGEANALLGPVLGERSVLLLDGAEHLRHRRLMLPAFHGQRMKAYESIMRDAADREIDSWPVGDSFELLPAMQALTLDVIMRAVFGVSEGQRYTELHRALRAMLQPISRPVGVFVLTMSLSRLRRGDTTVRRFEERRARVDELIFDEIARRREAPDLEEREDVFSTLLLARDEDGEPMTDQEIRDELVTLLVAGHETTATALAWTFDLLLHDDRVLSKLRASLDAGEDEYVDTAAGSRDGRRGAAGLRRIAATALVLGAVVAGCGGGDASSCTSRCCRAAPHRSTLSARICSFRLSSSASNSPSILAGKSKLTVP